MKTTRPRSFPASAQASISGRMFLSEWEKQSVFFSLPLLPLLLHCTHYMSSLPTNHVLEIEPGERVLSLDFTPLHPPNSFPSLPSPFFPPASHCFFVVIAGKSGARHPPRPAPPPPSYTITSFLAPFHSSGSLPPPLLSLCKCLAMQGNAAPVPAGWIVCSRTEGVDSHSELAIIRKTATHSVVP